MSQAMIAVIVALLAVGALTLMGLGAMPLFRPSVNLRERLADAPQGGGASTTVQAALRTDHSKSVWARLIAEVESRGISLEDTKAAVLAEKMMLAGFTQPYAVRALVLIRLLMTIGLPVLVVVALSALDSLPVGTNLYLVLAAGAFVGLYLPNMIVSSRASKRQTEILNGFPDMLDLMLVCVEAGLGIDACFNRVGQEITQSHPALAKLMAAVALELRAGRTRDVALRNLGRRSGVAEIGAFVTLLIQSEKLGSSIAQALKIYAAEMREARRGRAEEKAHRLPVLLSVPLVVFLLPSMMAVLLLPPAIQMYHTALHGTPK